MQHSLTTVDYPWKDLDNPRVSSNGGLVDKAGDHYWSPTMLGDSAGAYRTAVNAAAGSQKIFSTFACDAGRQNQPPVFVRDHSSQSQVERGRGEYVGCRV